MGVIQKVGIGIGIIGVGVLGWALYKQFGSSYSYDPNAPDDHGCLSTESWDLLRGICVNDAPLPLDPLSTDIRPVSAVLITKKLPSGVLHGVDMIVDFTWKNIGDMNVSIPLRIGFKPTSIGNTSEGDFIEPTPYCAAHSTAITRLTAAIPSNWNEEYQTGIKWHIQADVENNGKTSIFYPAGLTWCTATDVIVICDPPNATTVLSKAPVNRLVKPNTLARVIFRARNETDATNTPIFKLGLHRPGGTTNESNSFTFDIPPRGIIEGELSYLIPSNWAVGWNVEWQIQMKDGNRWLAIGDAWCPSGDRFLIV